MMDGRKQQDQQLTQALLRAKKEAFLKALCETASITAAAEAAGISRWSHYHWKQSDPDYVRRYQEALDIASETLESELTRRAMVGVKKYKFHEGQPLMVVCDQNHEEAVNVGTNDNPIWMRHYYETQFSDTVGIFLLKGMMPEKYRERYEVHLPEKEIDEQIESELANLAGREKAAIAPPSQGPNGNGAG